MEETGELLYVFYIHTLKMDLSSIMEGVCSYVIIVIVIIIVMLFLELDVPLWQYDPDPI